MGEKLHPLPQPPSSLLKPRQTRTIFNRPGRQRPIQLQQQEQEKKQKDAKSKDKLLIPTYSKTNAPPQNSNSPFPESPASTGCVALGFTHVAAVLRIATRMYNRHMRLNVR